MEGCGGGLSGPSAGTTDATGSETGTALAVGGEGQACTWSFISLKLPRKFKIIFCKASRGIMPGVSRKTFQKTLGTIL